MPGTVGAVNVAVNCLPAVEPSERLTRGACALKKAASWPAVSLEGRVVLTTDERVNVWAKSASWVTTSVTLSPGATEKESGTKLRLVVAAMSMVVGPCAEEAAAAP